MAGHDIGHTTRGWTLRDWQAAYRRHGADPRELLAGLIVQLDPADRAWIVRADRGRLDTQLAQLEELLDSHRGDLSALPLYGVPYAIKDNIDAGGWPTSAACPAFAYQAARDAGVVRRLRQAGAILIGKTNLDQFATGLVGTRSPHGAVCNTFDPAYISGGSSSGSASVLARGLVAFSLGTDTAGSGRIPAGLNNIVGYKPTRGWLSTAGVVPACRTLDCVSIFALTVDDADTVATLACGYDPSDPYSRVAPSVLSDTLPAKPRFAVPAKLTFFDDDLARQAFDVSRLALTDMGAELIEVDFTPFAELAALLYQGPWVAERFAAVEQLWRETPEAMDPVVRGIVEQAVRFSATDAFKAEYRRAELARAIQNVLAGLDALVVPTSPSIYTLQEIAQNPVALNSRLGTYTNFTNLADLSALALPATMRSDGLPAGITLIGMAWQDRALAAFGRRWQDARALPLGATGRTLSAVAERSAAPEFRKAADTAGPDSDSDTASAAEASGPACDSNASGSGLGDTVLVAVVGAHLRGMPLNHQLTSRGARFAQETRTAGNYRLYALAATAPPKPGLVKTETGASILVELWDVPLTAFGAFVAEIPAPLGIGTVELHDGRLVKGFICEQRGLRGAREITGFGGWRAYLDSLRVHQH